MAWINSNRYLACIVAGMIISTGIAVLLRLGGAQQSVYSVIALLGFVIFSFFLYRMKTVEKVMLYALMTMAVEALAFPFFVYIGIKNKMIANISFVVYLANGLGIEQTSAAVLAVSAGMAVGVAGLALLATYFMSRRA
ncbi:MAG: hypothetical protein NT157_06200 [Candidatus Micrarchaeota archaeon]|nr:hypothetical protein [Candidatus Micrarchaeota archaeon]